MGPGIDPHVAGMGCAFRRSPWWRGAAAAALAIVLVSCGGGGDDSTAPRVTISSPASSDRFAGGGTITVAASATDPQDGALQPQALTWWAVLHDGTTTTTLQAPVAGAGGTVAISSRCCRSADIFVRVYVRATDRDGRTTEVTRDVRPRTVTLALSTQPAGLQLALDGTLGAGTRTVPMVVGVERDLDAPDQEHAGRRWRFAGWSDGGARARTLAPSADLALTATFDDVGPVDHAAPSATLTNPITRSTGVDGTLTVAADAADNIGVTGVEFQLDGATIAELAAPPWTVPVDFTRLASGQHVLRVRARDDAGNVSPWSSATIRTGGAFRNVTAGFSRDETFGAGFTDATAFAQAPDGRWFVTQRTGELRVIKNGALLPTPFVTLAVDTSVQDRGLIGVALHPAFASNGWVYVQYTTTDGGYLHSRISRFAAAGDVAAGGETVIVDFPALQGTLHAATTIRFGPDGKLWVAVGDDNIPAKAQDLSNPFGKILRLNEDGTVPSDNPFCSTVDSLACGIYAYGFRNPYTFTFDATGSRLFVNDVGQSTWEEVNDVARAGNYGWPGSEGPDNVTAGVLGPLFTYRHPPEPDPPGTTAGGFFIGRAVIGGAFYPAGGPFPAALHGKYVFADYIHRWVAVLDPNDPSQVFTLANIAQFPVALTVGQDGAVHLLGRTAIVRISYP